MVLSEYGIFFPRLFSKLGLVLAIYITTKGSIDVRMITLNNPIVKFARVEILSDERNSFGRYCKN